MISYLHGTLISIDDSSIIIEVAGIGYNVELSEKCISKLPAINTTLKIHTYLSIKEDSHTLFGFLDTDLKKLFILLISVSGIGAKMAINILSKININDFISSIKNESTADLMKLPAVGKKTASRMIIDLKDKIKNITFTQNFQAKNKTQDAFLVLQKLGFKNSKIDNVLDKIDSSLSTEEIIKTALKEL